MNLQLFFDQLPAGQAQAFRSRPESLGEAVAFHAENAPLPDWRQADIAIFSVEEYRGHAENAPQKRHTGLLPVREALYRLSPLSRPLSVVDLGAMRLGQYADETQLRLAEVCEQLINHHTLPVIVGGSHDLDYGQFLAYQNMDKLVSVLQVDARVDMATGKPAGRDLPPEERPPHAHAGNHLRQILTHHPNYLFECSHLGHQRFLNPPQSLNALRALQFELRSLGELRDHFQEAEPVVRQADMMSFDLSAIKKADAMAHAQASPFGLTGEEACQLCWYAGMSEQLSSMGFYEYNPELDQQGHTASVLATMIWYFLEGCSCCRREYPFNSNFFLKYTVHFGNDSQDLVFYKSKVTEKWWMEAGTADGLPHGRNLIVPCSYADYETASRGEVPERWIRAQHRPAL
jgi:formiminoglutamase